MRKAFIFPGQGSQYTGMGKALWDTSTDVRRLYRAASERAGFDIAGLSFEGPDDELNSDQTAQAAVYVCNEAYRITAADKGLFPDVTTGYSLGFYSALLAAGCITFPDGLDAVMTAGELASAASSEDPGTMGAIIGLSPEDVEGLCGEAGRHGPVWVSNVNAARQVLVSGSISGVRNVVELASERGALKAYELVMGAAYHSPMMEGVARNFSGHVGRMRLEPPSVPVISYIDADYVREVAVLRDTISTQITRRVLWKDTVQRLIADGVNEFVEVGPGSALSRMVRWVDRGVSAVALDGHAETGAGTRVRRG